MHGKKVMLEMKVVIEETFKQLIKIPSRFWSKYMFSTNILCDTMVNDMSKEFNSIFVMVRVKLIVTMIEEIRVYLMLR